MIQSQLHSFLSRVSTRPGNWPNACVHVAPGAGAVLRIQRLKSMDNVRCETQALASIDPSLFDEFLDAVMAANVSFTSLEQTYCRLIQGAAGRMACFTFDGPSEGLIEFGYPALKKRNIPLTIFVSPQALDKHAAAWWFALEMLVLKTDAISLAVRGQTFRGRCHTLEEKAETLDNLVPLLLRQPQEAVKRAVWAMCEADGIDMPYIAAAQPGWQAVKQLLKDPLVSVGLLAPDRHAATASSYDTVHDSFAAAAGRIVAELGVKPLDLAFGAGWHGFVEQRDLEIASSLGFRTACLPAGGALFAEDATHFATLPRMLLSDAPDALLDAQAVCGAALSSMSGYAYGRRASVA